MVEVQAAAAATVTNVQVMTSLLRPVQASDGGAVLVRARFVGVVRIVVRETLGGARSQVLPYLGATRSWTSRFFALVCVCWGASPRVRHGEAAGPEKRSAPVQVETGYVLRAQRLSGTKTRSPPPDSLSDSTTGPTNADERGQSRTVTGPHNLKPRAPHAPAR